ncbi:hypothetical protein PsorP6_010470 [Peronosclerospora sorghi]|uniref:Uncharacterized protein n=1 Tax=Peronosclerospora sorghi TaxID=230839 RepID=A0ACC0VUC9_9STRA|nr:hypothetical protein PsorP6_010470 [Peronosclerospora sorghi]
MHRCLAHVINVAAQAALKAFGKSSDDDSEDAEQSLNGQDEFEDDNEPSTPLSIAKLTNQPDGADLNIKTIFTRVKDLSKKVRGSVRQQEKFAAIVKYQQPEEAKKGISTLVGNNATRWNSTFKMFQRVLLLRQSLKDLTSKDEFKEYSMAEAEWDKLQQMCDFLSPLAVATDILCSQNTPSLNLVIPTFLIMISDVKAVSHRYDSRQLLPATQAIQKKLNKYWKNIAKQPAYIMATVLDPRFKLKYLEMNRTKLLKLSPSLFVEDAKREFCQEAKRFDLATNAASPPP